MCVSKSVATVFYIFIYDTLCVQYMPVPDNNLSERLGGKGCSKNSKIKLGKDYLLPH